MESGEVVVGLTTEVYGGGGRGDSRFNDRGVWEVGGGGGRGGSRFND